MDLTQVWHYHRPALAELYLRALNSGVVISTTIFAPRRTGKTSFLLKDMIPAAEKAGFNVVYADLWQTRKAPGSALIHALETAAQPKTVPQKIAARLKTPVKSVKAGAQLAGASITGEMTLERDSPVDAEMALRIGSLLEKLCKKKPVLLLVDEAQELGSSKDNEAVATALRTGITLNQNRLRVVFTGSSRTRLAHVFSNVTAPLYSTGAAIAEFPLLDRGFVRYVHRQFKRSCGREFDEEAAWTHFGKLRYQPESFLKAIMSMVLDPGLSLRRAFANVEAELLRSENHEVAWRALDATQRLLVKILAADADARPFSNDSLVRLRERLGVDTLKPTHVQRAMNRLAAANVVARTTRGNYEFENPAFLHWVRTLAD